MPETSPTNVGLEGSMGLNYNTPEESITKGVAIASAITATDTSAAVTLIGVTEANFYLS